MLIVKIIILVLFAAILLSLVAGWFTLVKDGNDSQRTVKLLTVRVTLSILLFVFVALSFYMGWLQPHGIVPPRG